LTYAAILDLQREAGSKSQLLAREAMALAAVVVICLDGLLLCLPTITSGLLLSINYYSNTMKVILALIATAATASAFAPATGAARCT